MQIFPKDTALPRSFRFATTNFIIWWVFISLLAISFAGEHPHIALAIAITGGVLIGFLCTNRANCPNLLPRTCRLLWTELVIVILLSPFLLFPSPKSSLFLLVLLLLFVLHYVATRRLLESSPSNAPLALLLLMVLISLYATYDVSYSLPKVTGMLLASAVYVSVMHFIVTQRHLRIMILVFLMSSVALASLGMVGIQWAGKIPVLGNLTTHLPTRIKGLQGAEEGFSPNAVAGCLILFIPFQVALTYWLLRSGLNGRFKKIQFVVLLTTLLITGSVVLLTQSRGAWLGLAVALLVLLAWTSRTGRWCSITIALLGITALEWLGPQKTGDLIMTRIGGGSGIGSTFADRLELWNRAIDGISDFPFTGMGMNTFRKAVGVLYPLFFTSSDTDIAHCHNQLLQTALDLGIPGLVAYVVLLTTAIAIGVFVWRYSKEEWMRSAAQGLVCGIVAQQIFGITDAIALGAKVGIFFWMSLGLLAGMYRLTNQNRQDPE